MFKKTTKSKWEKRKKSVRAVTQDGTEQPSMDGWWERREGTELERAIDL